MSSNTADYFLITILFPLLLMTHALIFRLLSGIANEPCQDNNPHAAQDHPG